MKPKLAIVALATIAVVGFAVFAVLRSQSSAGGKRGASAGQPKARELAGGARSLVRDLLGRNPSEFPETTKRTLELVPFGTPLEAACQTMTEHQFICSVDSYTNPAQMSNSAIWNTPFVKNGQPLAITNVSRLKCKTNNCVLTFWLINGETTSLSVKGHF
jgi:hypothetical protein